MKKPASLPLNARPIPPPSMPARMLLRYAVAVLSIVLAWLARAALDPWLGDVQPFATFYIAVTFIAWWAGWRPGLVALVLGYFAAHWFFLPPRHALALEDFTDVVQHVAYFFVTGTIVILMHSLHSAHARESASAEAARRKQNELENQAQQRQHAEKQLRFQYQLLQSITGTAAVCIFVTDEQGRITFMNPEAEQVFGFSFAELQGQLMHDAIHHHYPDGRPFPQSECPIGKVYESGETTRAYEEVFFRKDGSAVPVVCSNAALWVEGKVAGAVLVAQDITERKQAQEALLREKEFSDTAINSLPGIFYLIDAQNHFHRWNKNFETVSGYSAEEIRRMTAPDFLAEEDRPAAAQAITKVTTTGEAAVELQFLTKAGQKLPFVFTGKRLDFDGQTGFLGVGLDISERKHAEEELARVNADLEHKVQDRTAKLRESVEELEGFSYSLVHDMRAPLRAMQTYASVLEEDSGVRLDPEGLEYLRKIKVAANRMDQLIQDSLNYSRVVREDLPLGPVNAGKLLRGLVETYPNLQAPRADVRLDIGELMVLGNEAALTQVFSNLLGNAVKFVAPGVKPKVRVWAEDVERRSVGASEREASEPEHALPRRSPAEAGPTLPYSHAPTVLIWVEDNGIGIPKEGQEKIFEMFQRMHRADEYPGTGIGLAIVRKSLERIGGRVCLDSEPGKGSRFCVELPRVAESVGAMKLEQAA